MRKIALLTSVLALTACTINIDAKSDNDKGENPGYNEYPSWGWGDDNNNQDYPGYIEPDVGGIKVSDLDKIDFKGAFDSQYKIAVSDDQIVAVTGPSAWTAHLENGNVTKITADTTDGVVEMDYLDSGYLAMQGKEVGLRFSDFGYLLVNLTEENEEDGQPYPFTAVDMFAGGYADKAIEKPAESMRFDGTATAAITYDTSYNYEEQTVMTTTNDASLYFDSNSGTETLTMNFSQGNNPWYDVQISGSNVILSNPGAVTSEGLRIKDDWLYSDADAGVNTRVQYFGENNNVTEAVATSTFSAPGAMQDDKTYHNIYVDTVFGGKRQ